MIAVDTRGRLGNQLFQYAFGVAAAQLLRTRFVFDASGLEPYFRLGGHIPPSRVRDALLIRRKREVLTDDRDDPDDILGSLSDSTRYGGFFYSHRYFAPAADRVRTAFRQRDEVEKAFLGKYGALVRSGYACAHVRLTDFRTYRGGVVLPPSYYLKALASLDVDLPVVFVTDDLETVLRRFGDMPAASFESNDEATDFLLLRNASVLVTSNSSFAWWGAWLNDRANRVFAPIGWLDPGSDSDLPRDAVPPTWERVPAAVSEDETWPFAD
jgi:Glycosyl transferase family 11